MTKRLLAIILIGVLCLSCYTMALANENKPSEYRFERDFLIKLGVLSEYDLVDDDMSITRADFVYYVSRLLALPEFPDYDRRYFDDVDDETNRSEIINYFAQCGYVSKYGNFNPDNVIIASEAYKILQSVLGYDAIAEVKGGYPIGYITIASKLDWINLSGEVCAADCIKLIFDAAATPYYTIESLDMDGNATYNSKSDSTILSRYYDIHVTEGFADSVNGITISGKDSDPGYMYIDSQLFKIGEVANIESFLSKYCEVFYVESQNIQKTVFAIRTSQQDDSMEIDISLIKDVSNDFVIEYYKSSDVTKSATSRVRVANSAEIIRNGSHIDKNVIQMFRNLTNGTVVLQKSGESTNYDYVVIKDYEDVYVGFYDSVNRVLYDKISQKSYDLDEFENVNVYNRNGTAREDYIFQEGELVSVATDGVNNFEAICELDKVTGVVDSVFDKGVTTGDKTFEYSEKLLNEKPVLSPGSSYSLYINAFGELAYITSADAEQMQMAYLLDSGVEGSLSQNARIKVYNLGGGITEYNVAKKFNVDGESYNGAGKLEDALKGIKATSELRFIRYSLDKDGFVSKIDTPLVGQRESVSNTLVKSSMYDETTGDSKYRVQYSGDSTIRRVGLGNMINTATKVLLVPTLDKIKENDYDEYSFKEGSINDNLIVADFSYDLQCYRTDDDIIDDYVVIFKDRKVPYTDESARLVVVDRIAKGLNYAEIPATQILGYQGGAPVKISLSDKYDKNAPLPSPGDLIAVNLDQHGELESYFICYDYSENKAYAYSDDGVLGPVDFGQRQFYRTLSGDYNTNFQLSYGYAIDKTGVTLAISSHPVFDDPSCVEQMVNAGTYGITLIRKDSRGDPVISTGTMNDIATLNSVGDISSASKVIIYQRFLIVKDVIVYN